MGSSAGRGTTVGVHLGRQAICLAKVAYSRRGVALQETRQVPFPAGVGVGSPAYSQFIRQTLTGFCGNLRRVTLWATFTSAKVSVRHLRIPLVSEREVAQALFWTFRKDEPFDEQEMLFDYDLGPVLRDDSGPKTTAAAYLVPRAELASLLRRVFDEAGCPLTGVVLPFFAFRNMIRAGWIPQSQRPVVQFFVGQDHSHIAVFLDRDRVLVRDVRTGMDSLLECLRQESGTEVSAEQAEAMLMGLLPGAAEDAAGNARTFELLLPALRRLTRNVEQTLQHYAADLGGVDIERVCVSGGAAAFPRIVNHIGETFNVPVAATAPETVMRSFHGSAPEARLLPYGVVEAAAAALGDAYPTPNLIFTSAERRRDAQMAVRHNGLKIAAMLLVGVAAVAYLWMETSGHRKRQRLAALEGRLHSEYAGVDVASLTALAREVQERQATQGRVGERYLGMAVLGELLRLTPDSIRLLRLDCRLTPPPSGAKPEGGPGKPFGALSPAAAAAGGLLNKPPNVGVDTPAAAAKEKPFEGQVVIDGVVAGQEGVLESVLAAYMLMLQDSPMFVRPALQESRSEPCGEGYRLFHEGNSMLYFVIRVALENRPAQADR